MIRLYANASEISPPSVLAGVTAVPTLTCSARAGR